MNINFQNRAHSASNFEPVSAKPHSGVAGAGLAWALAAIGTLGVT